MSRQPAFQFYTGDWRKDPELSRCSKAAKGVWIDALTYLWDMPIRGVFCSADGLPWPLVDIAYAIGGDIQENLACLSELTAKGVVRVRADGALFSKRMVDDDHERTGVRHRVQAFRERHASQVCNKDVTHDVTHSVTPLYEEEDEVEVALDLDVGFDLKKEPIFKSEIIYSAYPRKVGKRKALAAIDSACKRLVSGENPFPAMTSGEAGAFLNARVEAFARSPAGNNGQYTPHPATWFHGSRYLDDEQEWQLSARNGEQANGKAQFQPRTNPSQERQDYNVRTAKELCQLLTLADAEDGDFGDAEEPDADEGNTGRKGATAGGEAQSRSGAVCH